MLAKQLLVCSILVLCAAGCSTTTTINNSQTKSGETLFKERCATCHPDGRNIIQPQATLWKIDREARGVKTVDDLVGKMRNPGKGMPRFTPDMLPDADARAIAEYIIKTFN